MSLPGKAMVLAVVLGLLLTGCGAATTPLPDAARDVRTGLPAQDTSEPTSSRVAVLPTGTAKTLVEGTETQDPATPPTPAGRELPSPIDITIVYDNTAVQPGLGAEWGFAAWIDFSHRQILFDTGPDGPTLLSNLAQLGLDPQEIDVVVLSHAHGDHIGGLRTLLDLGIQPPVYAPRAFSESLKASVRTRTELIEVLDPVEILPGLFSTGQLGGGPAEQALVIRSSAGLVVLTGCAHPGILRIIRQARALAQDEIALVLGGFHLLETHPETVDEIVATFRELGVEQVAPTHCTGEAAVQTFATEYGQDCLAGGAGQEFVIGPGEIQGASLPSLSEPKPVPWTSPSPAEPTTREQTPSAAATSTPVVGAIRNQPGTYYDRVVLRSYPYWFKVHIPSGYQPGVPSALVFNLHGLGSNLEEQEKMSGMSAKADEVGFVVVYPQAGASVWNVQADEIGALHVELFRRLIDILELRLSIDPARIYATGFSNGGGMVHRLACDLSDRIAAIAPVAGAHLPDQECQPSRPVPVLAIHGSADRLGPYLDEKLGHNIPLWAADWAERNRCDPEPITTQEGAARVDSWEHCEAGVSVRLYSVEGLGHVWPGSPQSLQSVPESQNPVANDLIWDFFASHPQTGLD